jgi:3-oxoacyl-[acyl-carrier protein] reductase
VIDLTGYRVLVTGGSRGIGAACCRLFARAGAEVLVHFRRREAQARELVGELRSLGSGQADLHPADLSDPAEVAALFDGIAERWGSLDTLVLNAGVWKRNPIRDLSPEGLEETLDVNLSGVFWCLHRAIPFLETSSRASVITLASTAGQRGEAFYSPYAASKGAIIAATKSWATELAPTVRVNCVAPGWVLTEMTEEALAGAAGEKEAATIPLGRIASAEDIAGPVVFLASSLASHITGEILNVNGGSVLAG